MPETASLEARGQGGDARASGAVIIPFPAPTVSLSCQELDFRPRLPWARIALLALMLVGVCALAVANAAGSGGDAEPIEQPRGETGGPAHTGDAT